MGGLQPHRPARYPNAPGQLTGDQHSVRCFLIPSLSVRASEQAVRSLPRCRAEANSEGSESDWAKTPIGSIAKGAVHDVKDYGIVCDLEANPDVVGLAATHQVSPQSCSRSKGFPTAKFDSTAQG